MIEIGLLLRVQNDQEAKQAFAEVRGLAGAIWNDPPPEPYQYPDADLQAYLNSHTDISWDEKAGVIVRDTAPPAVRRDEAVVELHLAHCRIDIELAVSFNRSALFRNGYFFKKSVAAAQPHFDVHAYSYWVHRHISGNGMICYSPVQNHPLVLPRKVDIQKALQEGLLTATAMQPHDVVLFNHRLLHEAGTGERFHTLVTGTAPR